MNNYNDALDYIRSFGMYSNPPHKDLSKIKYLCGLFGNPQDSYKTIHIAGTNGKGSAAAMLANILKELGFKTGRYISPFIEKFSERISIDGADISEDDIIYFAGKIKKTLEDNNIPKEYTPNEFDFVTLMAFLYYREKGCEIAVIETGLGGRLDPTNAISSPLCSVIMSIGLDHTEQLGETVEKIAREKCGIIKQNSKAVLYPLNKESVIDIAKDTAREKNAGFFMPDTGSLTIIEEYMHFAKFVYKNKPYRIRLAGRHQIYNAITAIETINCLFGDGENDNHDAVYVGIIKTVFPARFEILSKDPLFIFDGAHNIPAISVLRETTKNLLAGKTGKKIILICGMLKDKNPKEALAEICAENFVHRFTAVSVAGSPRAETPENLCCYAAEYCENTGYDHDLREAIKNALDEAKGKNLAVICFGSLYLAGDVKKIISDLEI
jgi:dihydrofolate synthase/folylpolyglutamate synthase